MGEIQGVDVEVIGYFGEGIIFFCDGIWVIFVELIFYVLLGGCRR